MKNTALHFWKYLVAFIVFWAIFLLGAYVYHLYFLIMGFIYPSVVAIDADWYWKIIPIFANAVCAIFAAAAIESITDNRKVFCGINIIASFAVSVLVLVLSILNGAATTAIISYALTVAVTGFFSVAIWRE